MYNFSKWIEKIPESEIRRLLRYSPKYYFAGGKPGALALNAFKEILEEILNGLTEQISSNGTLNSNILFDYGPTAGLSELRKILANRLRSNDNVPLDKNTGWNDVVITTGSQQTLYSILDVMTNPNDLVLVSLPCYLGFLGPAAKLGVDLISIPSDFQGIIPEGIEKACEICEKQLKRIPKILYTIPYSDNPSGRTLSEKRKQQIFDIAENWDVLIAEDVAYKEIRFDRSSPLTPIKRLDKENTRVAYMSSTTKESGALRLGYSVFPSEIKDEIVKAKGYYDLCTSSLTQSIAKIYYEKYIDNVIDDVVEIYQRKCKIMKNAIDDFFPEGTRTDPQGGFFVWYDLVDEEFDTKVFNDNIALNNDILYVPGYAFYPLTGFSISLDNNKLQPQIQRKNGMRICYSLSTESEINDGIELLGKLLIDHIPKRNVITPKTKYPTSII